MGETCENWENRNKHAEQSTQAGAFCAMIGQFLVSLMDLTGEAASTHYSTYGINTGITW